MFRKPLTVKFINDVMLLPVRLTVRVVPERLQLRELIPTNTAHCGAVNVIAVGTAIRKLSPVECMKSDCMLNV